MAVDLDLFSSNNYRETIQNYCCRLGWNITDINDRRTILKFTMDSGTTQTLFIIRYGDTLEFSCPSGIKFRDLEEWPGKMSTALLAKNSSYKVGFWAIEEIEGQQAFSIMHNAEISLIDVSYFRTVVLKLISECDDFEQVISRALRNQ
jgi:hypothetical protein